MATRPQVSPGAALAVIAANVLWAADSLAMLALDAGSPSTAGAVWIALQALAVAGFAGLQAMTRRAPDRAVAA